MVTTRLYSHGTLKTEGFPVEDISDHILEKAAPSGRIFYLRARRI
jgi:hypothetical protein